ncbi:hypothetical protein OPQ81_009179 [Rhizoctonia solani]|nr:hypothetical protein OPQ81_009179 [Rhizoctonia solani]
MPANTSKRVRTESARKHQGCENEESIQHKATAKKASAKARKDRRDEAKEDNLLVERNGESDELSKLQALNLRLMSNNKCMHAQLTHCDEPDHPKPCQMIPEPAKLSEKDVEIICVYLWLVGEEHDFEWFGYWSDAHQLLTAVYNYYCIGESPPQWHSSAKVLQLDSATNDGETKPEDIPEDVQRIIEQEEVGVPGGSNIPLKPVPKLKHHWVDQDNTPNKSTAVNLQAKHQAVVQAKYGGKGVSSGSHASCIATQDPDEDELLVTSGETSSGSDDD